MKFVGKNKHEVWIKRDDKPTTFLIHARPCAFSWGSNGEGAACLALSILSEFVPASVAARHHQAFKEHYVNHYPDEWEAQDEDVEEWLAQRIAIVGDNALYDADLCEQYEVLGRARRYRMVDPEIVEAEKEVLVQEAQ